MSLNVNYLSYYPRHPLVVEIGALDVLDVSVLMQRLSFLATLVLSSTAWRDKGP